MICLQCLCKFHLEAIKCSDQRKGAKDKPRGMPTDSKKEKEDNLGKKKSKGKESQDSIKMYHGSQRKSFKLRRLRLGNQTKRVPLKMLVREESSPKDKISSELWPGSQRTMAISKQWCEWAVRTWDDQRPSTWKLNAQVLTFIGSGPSLWSDFGQFD